MSIFSSKPPRRCSQSSHIPLSPRLFSRTQTSAEFIIILSVALILFMSLYVGFSYRRDQLDSFEWKMIGQLIAHDVASTIDHMMLIGGGASVTKTVTASVGKLNYSLNLYNASKLVVVRTDLAEYDAPISGTDRFASRRINTTFTITNTNGTLTFS